MVRTPWGKSDKLRQRRLSPGPGTSREEVARNQRERLCGAMVAVATTKGYAETSVADLLELSGVSRRAFYEHFADKEACFLATIDEILQGAMAVTASRLHQKGDWEERAERSLMAFLEMLVAQSAAARLCLVEAHAAGAAAVGRVDEAIAGFGKLLGDALRERPGYEGMPDEMLWAMVGGMRKIVHTRLHRGTEGELLEHGPSLLQLALAYRPPPLPLRQRRRRGGRDGEKSGGSPEGPAVAPDGYVGERIVNATIAAIAEKGFAGTILDDIAERARISLSTFYEHFDSKEDAFDAALYAGRAKMLGYGLPAFRRAGSWPEGVRVLTEFSVDYLAEEPQFAQLLYRDVYAAGSRTLERLDQGLEASQSFIDAGVSDYAPEMPPIWREAITAALYAMFCRRVQHEGAETLPEIAPLATYMALAPFIGPRPACRVANGKKWDEAKPVEVTS
jgi:AcrR family transcriptional regulator